MINRLRGLDDGGSEAVQLAFALPLLILAFGVAAQVVIWTFSAIQFASAAESAAYGVDLEELDAAGAGTQAANSLLAGEIQARMLGADEGSVEVEGAAVEADTQASSSPAGQDGSPISTYTATGTTGTVSFTARYRCPSLVNLGEPLVLERTWVRDRLVSRRAEVA